MNQKVISCRVASAVVALGGIFLGNNHSNREAMPSKEGYGPVNNPYSGGNTSTR